MGNFFSVSSWNDVDTNTSMNKKSNAAPTAQPSGGGGKHRRNKTRKVKSRVISRK